MDDAAKALWNYSIEEITAGHAEEEEAYRCVFCGKSFEKGKIFQEEGGLYDAFGAVRAHVKRCMELRRTVCFPGIRQVRASPRCRSGCWNCFRKEKTTARLPQRWESRLPRYGITGSS